jgi:choline dehydrogenase
VGAWSVATNNIGIDDTRDAYGGENWGAYIATSAINPANWTRSYSKSGYLDPLPPRANYDVLANAQVTRLLFNTSSPSNNLAAYAVEYVLYGGGQTYSVGVNKEVILAAGTIGSPAVLLYSGVGPRDVLDAAGVSILSELPGVGQHMQDHLVRQIQYMTCSQTDRR